MPSYGLEIKTSEFWVHANSHVGYLAPSILSLQQNKKRTKTDRDRQINGKCSNSDKSTKQQIKEKRTRT